MRKIVILVKKEFIQIFRDKQLLPLITVMPIIQVILLSYAASYDINNLKIAFWDMDKTSQSSKLEQKYLGSGFFELQSYVNSQKEADDLLLRDKADLIVVIPENFEKELITTKNSSIQFQINALNNTKAGITNNYASNITNDFINSLIAELKIKPNDSNFPKIQPIVNYWYNPTLNYKTIMAPGIVAELLTMIAILMCALNIVKEKELGTIEQLNVTPLKKHEFIIGKLIPFWIIGHFVFWVGLITSKIFFNIPMVGSLLLLELFVSVFLIVALGFGLLISTLVNTQQQALFISFFFIIIFILMCGLFTSADAMPKWAQYINIINPIKYLVEVDRLILLKGSGFKQIYPYILGMLGYGIVVNFLAVRMYKKTN